MRKIPAVEEAKSLMTEAMDWGVWKWLSEKKKVRAAADKANAMLDEVENKVKEGWSDDLKDAYNALVEQSASKGKSRQKQNGVAEIDSRLVEIARGVFEADEITERTRQRAEEIFDEAERRLSTSMAKEGARKAIEGWELHEIAIRKAEAAVEPRKVRNRS
jgi:hypothetical protein